MKIVSRGVDRLEPAPHRGGHRLRSDRPAPRRGGARSTRPRPSRSASPTDELRRRHRASGWPSSRRCATRSKALRAPGCAGGQAGDLAADARSTASSSPGSTADRATTCATSPSPSATARASAAVVLGARRAAGASPSSRPSTPTAASTPASSSPTPRRTVGGGGGKGADLAVAGGKDPEGSTRRSTWSAPRPARASECGCSASTSGSKRIGVALSRLRGHRWPRPTRSSSAAATWPGTTAAIAAIVAEAEAEVVVVGLPLLARRLAGPAAEARPAGGRELGATLPVPVETYDERLTTVTADRLARCDEPGRRSPAPGGRQGRRRGDAAGLAGPPGGEGRPMPDRRTLNHPPESTRRP